MRTRFDDRIDDARLALIAASADRARASGELACLVPVADVAVLLDVYQSYMTTLAVLDKTAFKRRRAERALDDVIRQRDALVAAAIELDPYTGVSACMLCSSRWHQNEAASHSDGCPVVVR